MADTVARLPSAVKPQTVRAAGTIGVATLASRLLGFVRDVLIARLFGTSAPAQAFVVAFRLPNLLRDVVGEGAANAAIVPVLTAHHRQGGPAFWRATGVLFNVMALTLAVVAALGWWASPWVVRLTAPGFLADPAKFSLTVELTRWLFPYLWLIGLTALAAGVLNTLFHFAVPAYGPCLLNLAMIAAILIASHSPRPILVLAGGVLVGGALQLAALLPLLWRRGWRPGQPPQVRHPAVTQVVRLMGPRAIGSCVYQLNVLVDTICGSLEMIVGPGAVAALYYANRLLQFPLAIVGTALAQASLPLLAAQALERSHGPLKASLAGLLRMTLLLAIPSTVGLIVLGEPIVAVLFQHGAFTAEATAMTAQALVWYALGLSGYMGVKILTNACYALQDTRTPVRTAAVALGVNLGLNLALMGPMGVGGLALATSIASACNLALLWRALSRRLGPVEGAAIWGSARRVLGAAAVMALVCAAGRRVGAPWWAAPVGWPPAAALAALILLAAGTFLAACRLLQVEELAHLPWPSATR